MGERGVLFLTTDTKPRLGGGAEYVHQLCERLGQKGVSVTVYSTEPGCDAYPTKYYVMKKIEQAPQRALGRVPGDGFAPVRKLNTLAYYRRLEKWARAQADPVISKQMAVVIVYWPTTGHFLCEAFRRMGVPYILLCHGLELVTPVRGLETDWRRQDVAGARIVVCNSRGTAEHARRVGGAKVNAIVVHPAADPHGAVLAQASAGVAQRKKLGIPETAKVMLTLGHLTRRKGADLAIESLGLLKQQYPDLYLIIAGRGPEGEALENKARTLGVSERTVLVSDFDEEEKWALYAACDIFVMPTRTLDGADLEGFGIVFLEAALAGKPSVGGDNGGVGDAIVDGHTGYLVDTTDHRGTVAALGKLLRDQAARIRMGEAARQRALNEFSWEQSAERFVAACLS